jgi:hypothetical protein
MPEEREKLDIRVPDYQISKKAASHYRPGAASDAVTILYNYRREIQEVMFKTCMDTGIHTEYVPWNENYGALLFDPFLADHPDCFDAEKITKRDIKFFNILTGLLEEGKQRSLGQNVSYVSSDEKRQRVYRSIGLVSSINLISPGWAAFINEYGIFRRFDIAINDAYESLCKDFSNFKMLPLYQVSFQYKHHFNKNIFSIEADLPANTTGEVPKVYCPAHKFASTMGLTTMLNLALVIQKLLPTIPFLESDEPNRFRDNESIKEDYEAIVGEPDFTQAL